jgi:hypothetical protein
MRFGGQTRASVETLTLILPGLYSDSCLLMWFFSDVKLPYNVSSTCLLKIFHQSFPAQVQNEILQAYLTIPKEQFIEIRDCPGEEESVLNRKGETLIQVMECFADRG